MTIHVEIPEPLAGRVTDAATSLGRTPEEIVLEAVAKRVDPLAEIHELMAPVYERMQTLGITEDEAVEDFEAAKHALRKERRAAGQ
jgi:predicted DNA-binding protein